MRTSEGERYSYNDCTVTKVIEVDLTSCKQFNQCVVDRSRALRDAHVIFRTLICDTIIVQFFSFRSVVAWEKHDQ